MDSNKIKKQVYWKQIVFILTLGWIVIWLNRTLLTPIYPIISQFFGGVSDTKLGNISSFYFLGYVIMQIPSGILVDRFGKKKIMIPGFFCFGLGTILTGIATTLPVMYIASLISGIGSGTYYGVAYSFTSEYVPAEQKSLATAIVNSGTAIGSGLGLVSASYLVGSGILPWQYLYFVTAILIVVMILVFFRFVKPEKKQVIMEEPDSGKLTQDNSFKSLFKPQMIAAYILYFATLYTYYLINTWLPNFLETERGFEGVMIGFASSLVFFTAIPGALIFSRMADKYPEKKIQLIVLLELLAAVSLLFTINVHNQNLVIFGIMAHGFLGKLAVEPIIISWLGQFAPKKNVATMFGVFNFCGMASSAIVPSLTGYISDLSGGTKIYAFDLAIFILLLGTFVFYVINKQIAKKVDKTVFSSHH
ncbi:MFS transporter [Enterococcus sp. LJL99]